MLHAAAMTEKAVNTKNTCMEAPPSLAVIAAPDQAAALLKPLVRLRILERLRKPDSATGVATALGLPRQRVGYHLKELEHRGLVRHAADRRKGNCIERVLHASAGRYLISPRA
jgi:DNA-binding transcriptional ArsR family regulator